jgi:protein TonB
MSSYTAADRRDRWKAVVAALFVNTLLGVMIVTGLNVRLVSQAVERLTTIYIEEPPPPPPVRPPRPAPKPQQAKKPAGAPAPKAEPSPIVAPRPKLPLPSPIPAANIAGAGSASSSGAGTSGTGTGAGGSGNGPGGGGYGDFSRFTPARLVRNLSRGDYRLIAGGRMPAGAAMVSLLVQPSGLPSNCRIVRSSGDPYVDSGLCPLVVERLRFRPALDDQGRPVPYQLQYVATWRL